MQKLIIATHNKGKLKEFKEIFKDKFEVLSLPYNGFDCEIEESGKTFYENALIKARTIFENTGELSLGDDSGLCVNALDGAPGLYSARFGGENLTQMEKNKLLIDSLAPFEDKSAKFVCTLVLYGKVTDKSEKTDKISSDYSDYVGNGKNSELGVIAAGEGETRGKIIDKEKGDNGFGYDPIFYSDELEKTFGEATEDEKNEVSHRSRAIKSLLKDLKGKNLLDI